ncbi:MAG TPA: DUF4097 family beta strand repeat-containing protein [Pseudogracilibacillus sp.]|nr:DUF4097 family beta strand repeat-containing protein [Pseudogracilibacillus sp.]
MKKWIVIALFLIVIGGAGMAFTYEDAKAQQKEVQTETIDRGQINTINIESANSKVTIRPSNKDHLTVTYEGDLDRSDFKIEANDKVLSIQARHKWQYKLVSFDLFSFTDHIQVDLPEALYEKIKVDTDNGKISVADIDSKSTELSTANGIIDASALTGDLQVQSSNGALKIKNITGKVEAKTANGLIKLENITGDIRGRAANGKIEYVADQIKQDIELRAENGSIDIRLSDRLDDVVLQLQTELGSTKVNGSKDWDSKIGDGLYEVKLKTELGSIKINDRQ